MPELFIFLIKVNGSLVLFCLAYFLIMRRLTYYKLNRFFLLGGIFLSTVYPLLELSIFFKQSPNLVFTVQDKLPAVVKQASSVVDPWLLLMICFWTGVILMALRMAVRLWSLFKIHRQSTPAKVNHYAVRLLRGDISTFSFWNNIYLNPEQHEIEEIAAILKHEQVHVKDFHTLDILLAELATVFYWFNPGAWLMRKAIKENLEFITDQKTLQTGIDRKAYQYSMLQASTGLHSSELITNFNITATRRRIVMMNSKRTSSFYLLSYLLVIVGIVFAISAFTAVKIEVSKKLVKINTDIKSSKVLNNVTSGQRGTSGLTKLKDLPASTKSITTISLINRSSSVQLNRASKAEIRLSSAKERRKLQADAPGVSNVDTAVSANQATANMNSIKVFKVSKDTQDRSLEQARTYVNDKEVTPEQMKHINTENIISVNVRKNEDPAKNAIYIYTKPL
jgi:hypothetical protein